MAMEGSPPTEERDFNGREDIVERESISILERLKADPPTASAPPLSSEGNMAPLPAGDLPGDIPAHAGSRVRGTTYSMTKEKLLLTYRYMKTRLAEQPSPPTVIHIPPGVIYRRFGFGIALGKLIKVPIIITPSSSLGRDSHRPS